MKKSPVTVVKERFESKGKLVEAVQNLATADLWLDRVSATKGLSKVSNQKLVKLHDALSDAKQRFGTRDKLVSAILELKKRPKDANFASGLQKFPLPQLLDMHASVERAGKRAEAKKAGPAKTVKKVPIAKKAAAPVAKKTVAKKSSKKKKK